MTERKAWTIVEDNALKQLYEQRGIKKWAEISRMLSKQFGIINRSGKQCRQRYHNHLHSSIKHQKWSRQEENRLIQLHNSLGNRWAQISRAIEGRSQNCVKNQFYSILRRGLRKINSIIKLRLKRYKEVEINILYKIVQSCELESKFTITDNPVDANELKKSIAYYGTTDEENQEADLKNIKNIISNIKQFCKAGGKKKQNKQKKDQSQKSSEEIQSSQYRDDCPIIEEVKLRRNSLFSFKLQSDQRVPEEPLQFKKTSSQSSSHPQIMRSQSLTSNVSMEGASPRCQVTSPKYFDLFAAESGIDLGQNSITSPRPGIICDSPYFDQLRSNYSNWYQFYPH